MALIKEKVSFSEFFALLFLSLMSTVFMYISSPLVPIGKTDALLRPVAFVVLSLVAGLPAFFVYKKLNENNNKGLVLRETMFLRASRLLFGIVYFVVALMTIMRFDLFASSELFPGTDMSFFLVAIVVACGVLSTLGLKALCRGSLIFCFVVVAATLFVMLSLVDEIELLNFTPLFIDDVATLSLDMMLFTAQTTEIGAITLLLPYLKGNLKRRYIGFISFSGAMFIAIFIFVIGSLGTLADRQLFPTYTAVTLASFGLLERIDSLETSIWILCVIIKISFYIFVAVYSFSCVLKRVNKKFVAVAVCGALAIVPAFISNNVERFGFVSNNALSVALYVVSVVLLPLVLLAYYRRGKPFEKLPEDI